MTHLRGQTSVLGTVTQTEARLECYFASRRAPNGISRIMLRVPVSGTSNGLLIDREVRIEAWRDRDDRNLNDLRRISWTPEGSVVFPKFAGTLVVLGEGEPDVSFIELDGDYNLPLSAAGQLFDEAIGHHIAESTGRELLKDLKRGIEAQSLTQSIS
jgi:hypothetical protein